MIKDSQEKNRDITKMQEESKYLYHYTKLEALASILKNRTIRLFPLDRLDDLQERESADIRNAGRFCYVSCWTEDNEESIPMWNLYSSIEGGVRIRLKKNPFLQPDPMQAIAKGYMIPQLIEGCQLYPIEYTDDIDKLYPKLLEIRDNGQFELSLGKLGKHKNLSWKFQKEWRYLLHILPVNMMQNPNAIMNDFQMVANEIREGIARQACSFFDMKIREEAIKEMEIVTSPRFSEGNRILLDCIAKEYNPDAMIIDSKLKGLI